MLKNRQQYWVYILEQILSYVLHQAFINKKEGFSLTKEDLLNNIKVKIIVPEFETKNLDKIATSVNDIADFLKKGIDNKMISPETAGKIYRGLTELFGYTIKEDNELEKLLAVYGDNPVPAPTPEPNPNEPKPEPDVKPIK